MLADFRHASDAGVYLLDDHRAIVQTVDFFTPIVDDPYTFGATAAANSLSDLYAMGATPLTALSIAGFPKKGIDFSILAEMFRGGHEKLHEAGAVLLGGHTVQDPEIKFGYAVTGTVDPRRLVQNNGARSGDRLYLTKPIGTGVLATALKRNRLSEEARQTLYRYLVALNGPAAEAMTEVGISGATDITGFGLLGHAAEMARASGVSLEIVASSVPILPEAARLQAEGYVTGGLPTNRRYVEDILEVDSGVDEVLLGLFFDPQTSGGLLIAVPPKKESALRQALTARGSAAVGIGWVGDVGTPKIIVRSSA